LAKDYGRIKETLFTFLLFTNSSPIAMSSYSFDGAN